MSEARAEAGGLDLSQRRREATLEQRQRVRPVHLGSVHAGADAGADVQAADFGGGGWDGGGDFGGGDFGGDF